MLARESAVVRTLSHRVPDLGCDDDLIALDEVLDRPANDLLALTVGVVIAGVDRIDPEVQRAPDDGTGFTVALRLVIALARRVEKAVHLLVLVLRRVREAFAVKQDVEKRVGVRAVCPARRAEVGRAIHQLRVPLGRRYRRERELDADRGSLLL